MNNTAFEQALTDFKDYQRTISAYNHAMGVMYLDATTAAPCGTAEGRGKTMEVLSRVTYDLMTSEKLNHDLSLLEQNRESLDPQTARELEVCRKNYDQMHRIPANEYVEYSLLINDAQDVWVKAKDGSNFGLFAPYLDKIVEYNRKFAGYYNPAMAPYDALLNEYEEGLTTQTLDAFFAQLRKTIVPLLAAVKAAPQIDDSFLFKNYPIDKQRIFSDYLMEVLEMDRDHCGIAETEHPYTTNFNNKDVRITTHYYEDMLASSMFSVIHEAGHAIYELGADDRYNYTLLYGGVSMGIHESQSRFFENIIGRSYAFIKMIYPKLLELFPQQLEGVDAWAFYRAINKAEPSLIRTEADELTYCLHIMVRYELEKQMIDGTLNISDVPNAWNRLYREYLGIDVPDDKRGCLQDSHWSGGAIGYFPSYALGSAYGPQIHAAMAKDIGTVNENLNKGNISGIKTWLAEHIHTHASFYKPGALFEMCCGKFDAKYYTDYLTEKYTELYGLK